MKRRKINTFEQAEAYLNDTPRFTSKHTMEDTKAFLHRLGDPDKGMRILHVAGTNGKGSVCAYLRFILEAAGYKVALFTSPHLVDIRERFVVEGEMVSREDFLQAFLQIYGMLDWQVLEAGETEGYHPSYFEYLFFMAMILFPRRQPDFCILETGLGGRLDATNAVSQKELSIITRIGLDHVEYLGDTLERIAGEKAGILKAGVPAVIWDTCEETSAVFRKRAGELGISASFVSKKDYTLLNFRKKTIDFSVRTGYYYDTREGILDLTLPTIAAYQMENAALALRAIEILDEKRHITPEQIRQGIRQFSWPGRMEEVLPEVYVDGAHNEDGIRAFLETVGRDGHMGARTLLFGVVSDKDFETMIGQLAGSGLFSKVVVAHMQTGRGVSPGLLEGLFGQYPGCVCEGYDSVAQALREVLTARQPGERVYVVGSLYLAGEVCQEIQKGRLSPGTF